MPKYKRQEGSISSTVEGTQVPIPTSNPCTPECLLSGEPYQGVVIPKSLVDYDNSIESYIYESGLNIYRPSSSGFSSPIPRTIATIQNRLLEFGVRFNRKNKTCEYRVFDDDQLPDLSDMVGELSTVTSERFILWSPTQ